MLCNLWCKETQTIFCEVCVTIHAYEARRLLLSDWNHKKRLTSVAFGANSTDRSVNRLSTVLFLSGISAGRKSYFGRLWRSAILRPGRARPAPTGSGRSLFKSKQLFLVSRDVNLIAWFQPVLP